MVRLRRTAVDLKRQSQRAVVAQAVEGRRYLHRDRDAPLLGVEEVEVVLATEAECSRQRTCQTSTYENMERSSCTPHCARLRLSFQGKKHLHARTGTSREVEIIAATGPWRHARIRLAQSGDGDPRQALDGRVPCRMRGFDGYRTVALDEA